MTNEADSGSGSNQDSSDHNLLYVIMALRLGFITPDQLIASLHSWVDAKQEQIDQVMVRLGFMSQTHCELLAPLVQAFIQHNGRDAKDGLAAVPSPNELESELKKLSDKNLRGSIAQLKIDEDFSDVAPTEPLMESHERFRILKFHRQGGLGKVSIALDTELGREIAFKEILDEYSDERAYRERFLVEAEITGRLEHPGIVPVYGLGHFPDGRPFYAMRFIHGNSLNAAIQEFHNKEYSNSLERRTELRRLLERFLDVCEAIDYAHNRGVLHRDLKPGNIMLGRYGETLVVDWGLAKSVDRPRTEENKLEATLKPRFGSSVASIQGRAMGSPAFMSPEQARGEIEQLGPPTDIFGLGATLYCLLAGKPPYIGDERTELVELAKEVNIVPAHEIASDIPVRLSEICMKAMAFDQDDRHATAAELREDVWRWLADEPVSALHATVKHFEAMIKEWPAVVQYKIRLGRELSNLSKVYQSLERLEEAKSLADRAVQIFKELHDADQQSMQEFQELYFARTQLSTVLRALGLSDEAKDVDQHNEDQFKAFMKSTSGDPEAYLNLIEFTLHQGFSGEEAERLLQSHIEKIESDSPSELTDSHHTAVLGVDDKLQPAELPPIFDAEDRYSLISVLGTGGLGVVYRAIDNVIPREVAVKTLRDYYQIEPRHLIRELALISLLEHPNIIPIYDAGLRKDTNTPYFVMKLIKGRDLKELSQEFSDKNRFRESRWQSLLRGFVDGCRAIQSAHDIGIVHGDPKPLNVIVDDHGKGWLFDWGLSRVFDQERLRKHSSTWMEQTPLDIQEMLFEPAQEGIVGTLVFMSPEQANGNGIDVKSDIFVLGASLYHILTGQAPYKANGADQSSILKRIAKGDYELPRTIDSSVPQELESICLKAMALEREKRFDRASDIAEAISSWLDD